MFQGLTRIWTSLRTPLLQEGPIVASQGAGFSLYPMQENMTRFHGFSGQGDGRSLTPAEISYFLYDFALQDIESLRKRQTELKAEVAVYQAKPSFVRLAKLLVDGDYRHAGSLGQALNTRDQWINTCFKNCLQMVKFQPVKDIPVVTVSNLLFAANKLDLDLQPHLDSLLPILKAKIRFMHAEGLAEALWGLTTLGVKDWGLQLQLIEAVKGRKFVCEMSQGVPTWLDHASYHDDPDPLPGRAITLLREALETLAKSEDTAVQTAAVAELKARTP
jgi:hypothetical protein